MAVRAARPIKRLVVEAAGTPVGCGERPFTWNAKSSGMLLHDVEVHWLVSAVLF
jgi:hypothetical protein